MRDSYGYFSCFTLPLQGTSVNNPIVILTSQETKSPCATFLPLTVYRPYKAPTYFTIFGLFCDDHSVVIEKVFDDTERPISFTPREPLCRHKIHPPQSLAFGLIYTGPRSSPGPNTGWRPIAQSRCFCCQEAAAGIDSHCPRAMLTTQLVIVNAETDGHSSTPVAGRISL